MGTSWRRHRPAALAAVVLLVGSAGAFPRDEPPAPAADRKPAAAPAYPPPDPTSLWEYVQAPGKGYRGWKTFPGAANPVQLTELPHGDWVSVYVNEAAYPAIEEQLKDKDPKFAMPAGSILVKENYPGGVAPPCAAELLTLTVMYKPPASALEGRDPLGDSGWYWVMYSPSGYVQLLSTQGFLKGTKQFDKYLGEVLAGSPKLCTDCHGRANSDGRGLKDYLWNLAPFETSR